jgi:hypothetical protein
MPARPCARDVPAKPDTGTHFRTISEQIGTLLLPKPVQSRRRAAQFGPRTNFLSRDNRNLDPIPLEGKRIDRGDFDDNLLGIGALDATLLLRLARTSVRTRHLVLLILLLMTTNWSNFRVSMIFPKQTAAAHRRGDQENQKKGCDTVRHSLFKKLDAPNLFRK